MYRGNGGSSGCLKEFVQFLFEFGDEAACKVPYFLWKSVEDDMGIVGQAGCKYGLYPMWQLYRDGLYMYIQCDCDARGSGIWHKLSLDFP